MKRPRRLAVHLAGLLAFLPLPALHAQLDLPGLGGDGSRGHVEWQVRVVPETVPPGGEVEVVATYATAKGWYLYAPDHKGSTGVATRLDVRSEALELLQPPVFPRPSVKKSEIFPGESERTLEGTGEVRWRFRVRDDTPAGAVSFQAALTFMTCSEILCDPKASREFPLMLDVALPTAEADPAPERAGENPGIEVRPGPAGESLLEEIGLAGLESGGQGQVDRPPIRLRAALEPQVAARGATATLAIEYTIDEGWYMYAPDHRSASGLGVPFAVEIGSDAVELRGPAEFPKPREKVDTVLDETFRVLEGSGTVRQPIAVNATAAPGDLSFDVTLRGETCRDGPSGVCLPLAEKRTLTLTVSGAPPVAAAEGSSPAAPVVEAAGAGLEALGLWAFLAAMVGGGLFALVMPCTYPMIPITVSFFTKQADARRGSVVGLALAYGLGIIAVFNVIGLVFAGVIIPFAQSWPVNLLFGIAFAVFALSFFDLFTLRLPAPVMAVAGRASGASGYAGVFLLGSTLVITSFTCTAPVMGGLLAFAGGSGSTPKLVLGMTVFGATIAAPFVLLALFPARVRSLPRSGEWMHTVKVFLGFLELAAAIKFFSNADLALFAPDFYISREVFLLAWAVIFGVAGLYLLNLFRLKGEENREISGFRMLSGLLVVFFSAYFFLGARGMPLDWVTAALAPPPKEAALGALETVSSGDGGAPTDTAADPKTARWTIVRDDFEDALETARRERKLLLVNFTGHT